MVCGLLKAGCDGSLKAGCTVCSYILGSVGALMMTLVHIGAPRITLLASCCGGSRVSSTELGKLI